LTVPDTSTAAKTAAIIDLDEARFRQRIKRLLAVLLERQRDEGEPDQLLREGLELGLKTLVAIASSV
jgi:hypothetical protein